MNKIQFITNLLIILFIQFLGCLLGLELVALVLIISVSIYIALRYQKGTFGIPLMCIFLLVFQNLVIGLGAHIGGNQGDNLSYMTQVATVFLFINGGFILLNEKMNKIIILILLILFYFFANILLVDVPLINKLVYVRNYSLPLMVYLVARKHLSFSSIKDVKLLYFLKSLYKLSVFVAIMGIILYVMPFPVWKAIGISEVYIAKGDSSIVDGFNGRFLTNFIEGISIYRMASIYYEPVNLGYFFVASIVVTILLYQLTSNKKYLFMILFFIVMQIMTFGKGSYILTACLIIIYFMYCLLRDFGFAKKISFVLPSIVLYVGIFLALQLYYKLFSGSAVSPHFWGIEQTVVSIKQNPFGYGLGTGGNFAANGMDFSAGAETGLFALIYQVGIPVFLLILAIYIFIAIRNFRYGMILCAVIPLSLLFVSIYQENTFTPQCFVPIFFIACMNFNKKTVADNHIVL